LSIECGAKEAILTPERKKKLILRWSLATMALTAAFWGIWSLFAPVPEMLRNSWNEWGIAFPLSTSRWWDVLFAGPWVAVIIVTSSHLKHLWKVIQTSEYTIPFDKDRAEMAVVLGLTFTSILGTMFGLFAILPVNPSVNFVLIFSLCLCLIASFVCMVATGIPYSFPITCVFYSLGFGLGGGLALGLIHCFAVILITYMFFRLLVWFGLVCRLTFWKRIGGRVSVMWSWFIAKEDVESAQIESEPKAIVEDYDRILQKLAENDAVITERQRENETLLAEKATLEITGSESAKILHLNAERHAD